MKNSNFKQLALLGMTGGLLLASQSQANADVISNAGVILASNRCGANGCGTKSEQHVQPDSMTSTNSAMMQDMEHKQASAPKAMTESDLLDQLNDEGKKAYAALDAEGKALALRLANQQSPGQNKNDAVKAAARQMADKRAAAARRSS